MSYIASITEIDGDSARLERLNGVSWRQDLANIEQALVYCKDNDLRQLRVDFRKTSVNMSFMEHYQFICELSKLRQYQVTIVLCLHPSQANVAKSYEIIASNRGLKLDIVADLTGVEDCAWRGN